ncbi:MAG: hypothetical protein WCC94_04185 [Candidatus Bathyarchaeia archaeon]
MNARAISLKPLKQFAVQKLPVDSPLRISILAEDDEVPASELVCISRTWLALLRIEGRAR